QLDGECGGGVGGASVVADDDLVVRGIVLLCIGHVQRVDAVAEVLRLGSGDFLPVLVPLHSLHRASDLDSEGGGLSLVDRRGHESLHDLGRLLVASVLNS
ncbi:hypothetical protein PMAYCL1PPCAC_21684, partial [Pristionchus mayeri]